MSSPPLDAMAASPRYPGRSSRSSPTSANLLSLPHEILEQIFVILDLGDRLRLLRTCSALREMYSSSAPLQYSFTLQTSAYLDCPYIELPLPSPPPSEAKGSLSPSRAPAEASERAVSMPLSAYEKTQLLKTREERWTTMDAKHIRSFKVTGPEGVYELQEGIFLICDDYSDQNDSKPMAIRLIPLPSATDPGIKHPSVPKKSHKLKFPIADLTMDPTQDLIVVSESRPSTTHDSNFTPTHRYHLLTMSTFKPHPLAALPTLDFPPFTGPLIRTRQLLQVLGDTLVILVSRYSPHWILAGLGMALGGGIGGAGAFGSEEEIVAWNWKSGRVMMRAGLPENGWFTSFALLTPTTFMVTSASNVSPILATEPRSLGATFPPVIQIYSFAPDSQHSIIPVQPLDADYLDDTTPRPVLLAQLELPRFVSGAMVEGFDVRPDPAFQPRQSDGGPVLGASKPFTQNPYKGVMVFELHVREPATETGLLDGMAKKSYDMFLLRETLVEMAVAGEDRLSMARGVDGGEDGLGVRGVERTFSWAEWGEKNARLMDATMRQRSWVCSCSGYRYISIVPSRPRGNEAPQHEDDLDADMDLDELHNLSVPPRRSDLMLFDFAPHAVRKEQSRSGASTSASATPDETDAEVEVEAPTLTPPSFTTEVVTRPSVLEKAGIWKDDVVSGLPYRLVRRDWGERANGVMIDDQRIIIIRTRTRRNGDWSEVSQEMTVLCM